MIITQELFGRGIICNSCGVIYIADEQRINKMQREYINGKELYPCPVCGNGNEYEEQST